MSLASVNKPQVRASWKKLTVGWSLQVTYFISGKIGQETSSMGLFKGLGSSVHISQSLSSERLKNGLVPFHIWLQLILAFATSSVLSNYLLNVEQLSLVFNYWSNWLRIEACFRTCRWTLRSTFFVVLVSTRFLVTQSSWPDPMNRLELSDDPSPAAPPRTTG